MLRNIKHTLDCDLFREHSRLFLTLQIKHVGGCHTLRKHTSQLCSERWHARDKGPIQLIVGEKETRKKRPKLTSDVHVCVCPFIIMFVCAWSYCFYFFCCLSVRSSAPLSVYLSISPGPLCICAEFGQHLRSVLCAWFVFLSSGSESIPLSESECQLCEAKLSQIL